MIGQRSDDQPPRLRAQVKLVWLWVTAVLSGGIWLLAEFVLLPRLVGLSAPEIAAAQTMEAASATLIAEKERLGIFPGLEADPNRTGMIGPEFTVITTSLGSLSAKRTTTVPDFAAALVREIASLHLASGAPVVIIVSGSLVGGNIAAIAAVEALGLRPVIVASTSASMWGATDPGFTWLDIQAALNRAEVIEAQPVAAVIGGTGGTGREMDPSGIAAIRASAEATGVRLIEEESLGALIDSTDARVAALLEEEEPGLVINVGAAVIGLGNCRESYEFPPGLNRYAGGCTGGTPGIVLRLAEQGVPVLHVLNIRRLALEWGLPFDPVPLPAVGSALR